MPRPYNVIDTGWQKIDSWLTEATKGNQQNKQILICFAAAVLQGRCDLQKFLCLTGVGGTGKSTYTSLLQAVIGSQNCWIGSIQILEDKHEVAKLLGKRLVLLPDQDKVKGRLSNFKRLTGQDNLSGRHLYKNSFNFRYNGMVVATSNDPIFYSDGGSWRTRRIIMLPFNYKPVEDKVLNLEAEFRDNSFFTKNIKTIWINELRIANGSELNQITSRN